MGPMAESIWLKDATVKGCVFEKESRKLCVRERGEGSEEEGAGEG